MSDVEQETYLHKTRTEAWDAFMKRYSSTGDAGQIFAAAAEVYERELRVHLDVDEASDRDYAAEIRSISIARDIAHEILDELDPERPMAGRLRTLIAELGKVLGPDLVREADPTGTVLKALPYEQRKAMLDAIPEGPGSPEHERVARQMMGLPALEVGSPEHDAFCMDETAKMAAEAVARGEGE